MIDAEILVETGDRGKPPFDCPVGETRSLDGETIGAALPITCRLLAFDEGKDIERSDLQYRLLNRVQEDLKIVAIAYHGIKPASISDEFEISVCFGHFQRDIHNSIHHLPLKSIAQR